MSKKHQLTTFGIILMSLAVKEVIKRTVSNRENSLRDRFIPDMSIRRTSLELSSHLSPKHLKPILHGNKHYRTGQRKKEKGAISIHPFSFSSHKNQEPEQFKSNEKANAFIYSNYDILDLSYSLISSQINMCLLSILYTILLIIRYGSLLSLIYIMIITDYNSWKWIFCIVITYMIYFISMMKVSLRPAENKCQTVLKLVFDSLQSNQVVEYFQVIDLRKLMQSILHALIPPEFSFLYIVASSKSKRIEIYCMINYIYSSIEAIIYYPFFVIYTSMYFESTLGQIPEFAYLTVIGAIVVAQIIFLVLTLYLIWYGCKKRGYGRTHSNK